MPVSIFPAAKPGSTIPAAAKGEMTRLIDRFDWSKTVLGPLDTWPAALTVTVRLMLASDTPMVMLMGQRGVLVYNDAYSVFAGNRHPDILGQEVSSAWPEIADYNLEILRAVLDGQTVFKRDQKLTLNRDGTFSDVWLDLDYSPVLDEDGSAIAELVMFRETTERVLAERALARSEESLSFALAASGMIGVWDWDVVENSVIADERFAQMYGVDPDLAARGTAIEAFLEGIHPEDRVAVGEAIQTSLERLSEFRKEYRLLSKDGQVRWVLALGRAMPGENGLAARLPGVVIDITESKAAEAALKESEARFKAIADTMPQMVWSTLPDGFHDYYNARWYEFTGVPEGTTDGEGWNDMFHPDDRVRAREVWQHALRTGDIYQIEYRLRHRSGEYRWVLGRAVPIHDEDGRIIRWFGTCTDIHETRLLAEEREIVSQELSHRIKNIFSVLVGIVGLSARSYPEAKAFADQLRERIFAMGVAHDFVRPHSEASRPRAKQTSFRALVDQLLAPYRDGAGERITHEGPDTTIDDAAATPIALFFHELATNAAKYGALSVPGGSVVISAAIEDENYRIRWIERAPGRVVQPPREGFGTRLMGLSVQGQLGGTLRRTWNPEGLEVEAVLPMRSLMRSDRLRRRSEQTV